MSFKALFSRALSLAPERLHFAAHSHHLWPDASFEAQQTVHRDLPKRVEKAAEAAFHTFRDLMPVDSLDAKARHYRWCAIWTLFVLIIGILAGGGGIRAVFDRYESFGDSHRA
jgi:hypothetical protein